MDECARCKALEGFILGQLLVEMRRVMTERDDALARLRIARLEKEMPR